jgi:hypothetical protein
MGEGDEVRDLRQYDGGFSSETLEKHERENE